MKVVAIIAILSILVLLGCVSNTNSTSPPSIPSTNTPITVQQEIQQVGKEAGYAESGPEVNSARAILEKARTNYENATFFAKFSPYEFFGTELNTTEAKRGNELFGYSTQTDWGGILHKKYFVDGVTTECTDTCEVVENENLFIDFAKRLLEDEKNGAVLKFGEKVVSGKLIGRDCDQIDLFMDYTSVVGQEGGEKSEGTVCLDRQYGIPLYFKASGGGFVIEIEAESVTPDFDESIFTPPASTV